MNPRLDTNSKAVQKRIQTHDFHDELGEEYEASSFGGFGDYMRRKKLKLQNLDSEIRATSNDPPIFRGIVAHVNGYTQPSLQDLHRLIVSHGGGFLQYLDGKTSATHIIASALTPKKREEFRRYRIVKPAWVTESIKAGRLLPWNDFRVVGEGQSQKVLKFGSGGFTSQSNSPRSTYRDQSNTSWHSPQLQAKRAVDQGQIFTHKPQVTSESPRAATQRLMEHLEPNDVDSKGSAVESKESPRSPTNRHIDQQFQNSTYTPRKKHPFIDTDEADELESPRKEDSARIQNDPVLSNSAHKPLNLSGSQFIIPPQPDIKGPSGTQCDIRSRLKAQGSSNEELRSKSPCPPPRQTGDSSPPRYNSAGFPSQAQLDLETLAALPDDIRNEILGFYNQEPASFTSPAPSQTPSTSIPHSTPSNSSGQRRRASPLSKKPSRPPKPTGSNWTLMQLGFVSQSATIPGHDNPSKPSPPANISPRPSPQPPAKPHPEPKVSSSARSSTSEGKKLNSSTKEPTPTPQRVSTLDDLKESIGAWHSAFAIDGPYKDDVESMCTYLRRVITEERDVDKPVLVVQWLMQLIDKSSGSIENPSSEEDAMTWVDAARMMQESIHAALSMAGLPSVEFG